MTIELTDDEYDVLLMMSGYAAGAADQAGDQPLKWVFVKLANRINKGDPNFRPYAVPEEFQ
jgi:hypothetical protein